MNRQIEERVDTDASPWFGAGFVRRCGVSLAGLGMVAILTACAAPQPEPQPEAQPEAQPEVQFVPVKIPNCELPVFSEGRKYQVEAWAIPDARFDVGEPLKLQMRVSTPSYVNIFYVSSSCKVTRLLANRETAAARIVDFPLPESGLEMTVKPPAGDEAFYFVATRSPMDFLAASDILTETMGIASLDLSPAQFYQHLMDARGRINPDDWSIATLTTSVVAR